MRKLFFMATAAIIMSSPAAARDGQPYFGIEGGVLFPKDQNADIDADFQTSQTPATPAANSAISAPSLTATTSIRASSMRSTSA